jgi:multidrug efflux pump subunit AcrA (membrane-fusion protein)
MNIQAKPNLTGLPLNAKSEDAHPNLAQKSKIERLLACEADMREVTTHAELSYLLVNDWRGIINASQIYILEMNVTGTLRATFASNLTKVDPRSPLCAALADLVVQSLNGKPAHEWHSAPMDRVVIDGKKHPYSFACAAKIAFKDELPMRYIVALSPAPMADGDRIIAARLGATAAHAYWALAPKAKRTFRFTNKARLAAIVASACIALGFVPVPLSILAPVEIVAQRPFIAAAPLSGVIDSVDVETNATVEAGAVLFRLNDVELKATLDIAQKSVAIAEARLRRAQQGAGASTELRREVGLSQSELALSVAERDGALARLERTIVRAPYAGVVMFNRKEDWIGKPVSTGERILEIADPKQIEAAIEVGLADSIVLDNPQSMTLFLDANPLRPIAAKFKTAGYQSQYTRAQHLAFPVRAFVDEENHNLRIGQRGTAQIRAQNVSLAYFLFRRPLAALRQKVGL